MLFHYYLQVKLKFNAEKYETLPYDVSLYLKQVNCCFTDIDECASAPCQNGGTCIDQVNGYLCQCAPGYTDLQCQTGTNVIV